jgi:hypothetical protein
MRPLGGGDGTLEQWLGGVVERACGAEPGQSGGSQAAARASRAGDRASALSPARSRCRHGRRQP